MRRKAVQNTLVQVLALGSSFVERVLVVALLVRFWGADDFAAWVAILAVTTLISVGELSINIHFGNRWQKLHAAGEVAEFGRVVGVSLTVYTGLCFVLALLSGLFMLAVGDGLGALLKADAFSASEALAVFALLALAQICHVSAGSLSQVFRGRGDFALGQLIDFASNALTAAAAVASVLMGGGPVELALTYLLMQGAARWVVLLTALRFTYRDLRFTPVWPRGSDFALLKDSLRWLSLFQLASVLMVQAPILLLVQLGAPAATVIAFITARTLFNLARTFGHFASIGLAVEIAGRINATGWEAAWLVIRKTASFLQVLLALGAGGLMAFSEPLMLVWTGDPSLYDQSLFAALCFPLAFSGALYVLQNSLMFADETRRFALLWAGLLAGSLLAGTIGYGLAGAVGFALGLAFAELAVLSFLLPVLARGLIPAAPLWRLKMLGLGILAALAGYLGGVACLAVLGGEGWKLLASGALWAFAVAAPVIALASPRVMRTELIGRIRSAFA
jgi:O-antigen/teichoic acid export membrane protein